MTVTYKQVGEGCKYTIMPMYSGAGEILSLSSSKRREPAKSGLMLSTDVAYPLGTLVQLDIIFPGQEYTYRAKGIVSWIDSSSSGRQIPIGITITGMDKLDKYGISVSISEPQPRQPEQPPQSLEQNEWDDEPVQPAARTIRSAVPATIMSDEIYDDEMADTALNPILDTDEEGESGDIEEEPAGYPALFATSDPIDDSLPPLPQMGSRQKTRIQDFLSPRDFNADTIPPSRMPSDVSSLGGSPRQTDPQTVRTVFQTLSLMMPQEGFGEKVYFEDVVICSVESIPQSIEHTVRHAGKRSDFLIRIEGRNGGRMCAILPQGDSNTPPSAYVIEQLLLMYFGMSVQVIRDRESELDRDDFACLARLASASTSMRAVMAFDEEMLTQLIRFKDGPIPFDEDFENGHAVADVAYDDRTSRVSLVVAENNDRHRKTVPIEARVSVVPSKVTGPISAQINDLVTEAFESMETLFGAENHDDASRFALSLARRLIKCEAAICALTAPEKTELYISAIDGAIPETRLGARLSLSDGLIGFCMRAGKVARSEKPDEIKASLLRETGLAVDNIMCAPIVLGDKPVGAIELINSTATDGFTRETADLLAYIANSLGDFISGTSEQ